MLAKITVYLVQVGLFANGARQHDIATYLRRDFPTGTIKLLPKQCIPCRKTNPHPRRRPDFDRCGKFFHAPVKHGSGCPDQGNSGR